MSEIAAYNPIVFYDGDCGFCNSSVQFILNKRKREFYFLPLQSDQAKKILNANGIEIKKDLDEKIILDWASKVSKKYVSKEVATQIHDKAAPFIKWLKEAEEESEDSEEDDDDIVGFDDRAKIDSLKSNVVNKPIAKPVVEDDDDGEELDIDNI